MTDSQDTKIEPLKTSIGRHLTRARTKLLIWLTLDYVLLILGIAFPLIAAYIGGKSVVDGQALLGPSDHPEVAWPRTCGYMALIALVGALANALHKALNMEKKHKQLSPRKTSLEKLYESCGYKTDDKIHAEFLKVIGSSTSSDAT